MSAQVISSGGGGASAKFKANNRNATKGYSDVNGFRGVMFPITNPSLNEEKAILTMTTHGTATYDPILNSFYDNGEVKNSYLATNNINPSHGMMCIRYNGYMIYAAAGFPVVQNDGSAKFEYYTVNIATGATSALKTVTVSGLYRIWTSGTYWDGLTTTAKAAYSYAADQGAVIDKWGRVLIPFCFGNSTTDSNYSYRGYESRYIMAISNITTNPTAVLWQVGNASIYYRSIATSMHFGDSTLYIYDVDDNTQCVVLSFYGNMTNTLDKPLYNYMTKLYITSSGLSRYEDTLVTSLPFTTLYFGQKNAIRYYENNSVYELSALSSNSLGDYVLVNKIPIDETTMLPNVNLKTALGYLSLKGRCMVSPTYVTGYGYSQPSVISIQDEKEILIDYPYYRIEPLSLSKFETV